MVLALRQGNGLLALTDDSAASWLEAYENGEVLPMEKLDNFLNPYKKINSDKMLAYIHGQKFTPKGTQGRSIKMLNLLRNKYVHFLPQIWMLDASGLPRICLDCLEIIQFLAWESGNVLFYKEPLRDRATKALNDSLETFTELEGNRG